jgi:cysteine desulfurase family protein (TIGR01976 family)
VTVLDVDAVRARFSSLSEGFAFFDAPGGTQVPDMVAAAVARNYREASGNLGAPYETSRRIEALVDEARERSATFLGATPEEITFGANMTSLNFTLSRTVGRTLSPKDEIVVTALDHDANVAPWLELAHDKDLVVRQVGIAEDTTLDYAELEGLLSSRTRVVAFPLASNALGTVVDAARVCSLAHEAGAIAWVDAVQYAPHFPIDVKAVDADVLICSAYKFCGPHLGIAYGRRELVESWRPYKARPSANEPVGHRFETGTLPYELLAALVATFDYLDAIGGTEEIVAWERRLGERFLAGMPEGTRLYGSPSMEGRVPTFLVNYEGIPSAELSAALAKEGFGVWSGDNYYALALYERLQWRDALRVGIAHYNTLEEVDRLNETLALLVRRFEESTDAG